MRSRSPLVLIPVLLSVWAVQLAYAGEPVTYRRAWGADFSRREKPAQLTEEAPERLLDRGYIEIGAVESKQIIEVCRGKGASKCKARRHDDPTSLLLEEAAKNGGDLLRLISRWESTETELGEKCVNARRVAQREYYCPPTGGAPCGYRTFYTQECLSYESTGVLVNSTRFVNSAGSVWRHEPGIAAAALAFTDFMAAAERNDLARCRDLLSGDLPPTQPAYQPELGAHATPFHFAARRGYFDVVLLMLDGGVNVDARDYSGRTALAMAVSGGHFELSQELIARGATVDDDMLTQAARNGDTQLVRMLLEHGAKPTGLDGNVLLEAAKNGDSRQIQALIAAGVDLNDLSRSNTPLMEAARDGDVTAVRTLLQAGANVNTVNESGSTALMWATNPSKRSTRRGEVMALLLEHGAETEALTVFGESALIIAVGKGLAELVELLLEHGANPGGTPTTCLLARAVYASQKLEGDRTRIVKMLLDAGADVNAGSSCGLREAVNLKGMTEVVKMLLEAGADPNLRNALGTSVMDLARRGHVWEEYVAMLEAYARMTATSDPE